MQQKARQQTYRKQPRRPQQGCWWLCGRVEQRKSRPILPNFQGSRPINSDVMSTNFQKDPVCATTAISIQCNVFIFTHFTFKEIYTSILQSEHQRNLNVFFIKSNARSMYMKSDRKKCHSQLHYLLHDLLYYSFTPFLK